ncbi:MAG: acyl-CoA thioesterase [Luteolibacter sp.]
METIRHRYECEIAFADTDASGRVHFSNILRYVERAEHDFFRHCGVKLIGKDVGWPRVKVSCEYERSLIFGGWAIVKLQLKRVGGSSLTWAFEVHSKEGERAARGEMVCVKVDGLGAAVAISFVEKQRLEGAK